MRSTDIFAPKAFVLHQEADGVLVLGAVGGLIRPQARYLEAANAQGISHTELLDAIARKAPDVILEEPDSPDSPTNEYIAAAH